MDPNFVILSTPFRGMGDFLCFLGVIVSMGFIVIWTIRRLIIEFLERKE